MAVTPYDLEEVRTSRQGVTHLIVSDLNPDVDDHAHWSMSYHLTDDLPLCGQQGDQAGPRPNARMCKTCEGLLEMFEWDINRARERKAEGLAYASGAIGAAIKAEMPNVGW